MEESISSNVSSKTHIPSITGIIAKIRRALKSQGTYTEDLDIAIRTTAGAYRAFLIAQKDVSELECTYYLTKSREGNVKYVQHPAIRSMKDTQGMVLSGLKSLGLTLESLSTTDYDPLDKLINDVGNIRR